MSRWEYLIHRAQLAGIKVDNNGVNVEFRTEVDGIDVIGLFWLTPESNTQSAADWLIRLGVNLPGWDLPWPGDTQTDIVDGSIITSVWTWPDEEAEMRADIAAEKAAYDYEVGR